MISQTTWDVLNEGAKIGIVVLIIAVSLALLAMVFDIARDRFREWLDDRQWRKRNR